MEVSGQRNAPAVLFSVKNPISHFITSWVVPRADPAYRILYTIQSDTSTFVFSQWLPNQKLHFSEFRSSFFFLSDTDTVSAYITEADVGVGYNLAKTVIVTTASCQLQHRVRIPTVNVRTLRIDIQFALHFIVDVCHVHV
jgi:hypothetical protein